MLLLAEGSRPTYISFAFRFAHAEWRSMHSK